jgi:DNA polymerase-3 subunit alpha
MSEPAFVHLRLHSEYSIVDGTVRIDDAVRAARDDAMPALALTDLSNLFGLVKFYQAARESGVKPILGCDVWITHATERDSPWRALLLATGRDGKVCATAVVDTAANAARNRHDADLWIFSISVSFLFTQLKAGPPDVPLPESEVAAHERGEFLD